MGDYTKAEPLFQRALKISEKTLGPDHDETALHLNNLASVYDAMGDYAKAEPLYQRALEIRERTLGPDHPYTANSLYNLTALYLDMGKVTEAMQFLGRLAQAHEKHLANILSFTSEEQRLAFQKTVHPYTFPATLGLAPLAAETILRYKGVVLDSLLEDRLVAEASADPQQREAVTELRRSKQQLMQLLLEVPKDLSAAASKRRETEKADLSKRIEELEAGLARQVVGLGRARRALTVTVGQIQAALAKDDALIELLRYKHYLGSPERLESRYGAVVILSKGEPKWIPLGSAAEIDKNIKLYQKSAREISSKQSSSNASRGMHPTGVKTDEGRLGSVLRALHTQIWAPIEKALPNDVRTIILSPDGELSFVSFVTLLGPDDRFLAEKYSIRYVAAGRDLLREGKSGGTSMTVVFANPDFAGKTVTPRSDQGGSTAVVLRSMEMRDLQSVSLPRLPGTAAEAAALAKLKEKFKGGTQVFLGSNATEAELRRVKSPRILHLATHGFFLPEIELPHASNPGQRPSEIPKGKLVNPMHRSGLALAGAQRTLEAWSRGEVPPTDNDGIVTAEEVGGLKLDGTWLVVLSACDTGSGEARAGEGVMGLRRGFIQAGAQNLLMTLWPISDQITVQMMLDFYDAALKTGDAPRALADVQRDWLVKLRKERGLQAAVNLAGPFIMSSQGRVEGINALLRQ